MIIKTVILTLVKGHLLDPKFFSSCTVIDLRSLDIAKSTEEVEGPARRSDRMSWYEYIPLTAYFQMQNFGLKTD